MSKVSKFGQIAVIALAVLVLLSAFAWESYKRSQKYAVYAGIMDHIARRQPGPDAPPPVSVFFVQENGSDLPPSFTDRFKGAAYSVRPGSQCTGTLRDDQGINAVDNTTGEKGVRLNFGRIMWNGLSPTVYTNHYVYFMKRDGDRWAVESQGLMVL